MYNVVVIGGGPAGLSAAIYLSRAKVKCIVLEEKYFGGQIAITNEVENYPGFLKISGSELTQNMHEQGVRFGAEYSLEKAVKIECSKKVLEVKTSKRTIQCSNIIIATGASPRKAGFDGEETYIGKGVSYCATCDGRFFDGKEVFVVGAGYSACQESLFLSKFASKVKMIIRKDKINVPMSIVTELINKKNIDILYNSKIYKVDGDDFVKHVYIENTLTGEKKEYLSDKGFGIFVFTGYKPNSEIAPSEIARDEGGYLIVDDDKKTSIEGIYAVGDVSSKNVRQVVTSANDGVIAAKIIEKMV